MAWIGLLCLELNRAQRKGCGARPVMSRFKLGDDSGAESTAGSGQVCGDGFMERGASNCYWQLGPLKCHRIGPNEAMVLGRIASCGRGG